MKASRRRTIFVASVLGVFTVIAVLIELVPNFPIGERGTLKPMQRRQS